jgi:hypothetical protein
MDRGVSPATIAYTMKEKNGEKVGTRSDFFYQTLTGSFT